MTTERTALILGATGGVGGEAARRLSARGWNVRALRRALSRSPSIGAFWSISVRQPDTQIIDFARVSRRTPGAVDKQKRGRDNAFRRRDWMVSGFIAYCKARE